VQCDFETARDRALHVEGARQPVLPAGGRERQVEADMRGMELMKPFEVAPRHVRLESAEPHSERRNRPIGRFTPRRERLTIGSDRE
jgi:hypothetical protein